MTTCPICGGSGEAWAEIKGLVIQQCKDCGHRFFPPLDPERHIHTVYSDDYFIDSAEGYVDYLGEEPIQRASARYYASRLRSYLPEQSKVLDVGAACGFFLDEFQKAGWNVLGLEPNSTMRQVGNERFGLKILAGSLQELSQADRFDLISVIQVVSHLIDPVQFVQQAYNRLAPGGLLLIETWDRESLAAKIVGKKWHEYNPPSVLHWFSRASLKKLVGDAGFELVDQGWPRKRIQLGRALKMLRHSFDQSPLSRCLTSPLLVVPERISLPYMLGDAFWMLFQRRS